MIYRAKIVKAKPHYIVVGQRKGLRPRRDPNLGLRLQDPSLKNKKVTKRNVMGY